MKYLILLAILVLGWCPWFKADEAMQIVDTRIAELQVQHADLCAMNVFKDTIKKVPFGYTEEVSYDCRVTDSIYGVPESHNIVFITFFKGLVGMPEKTISNTVFH